MYAQAGFKQHDSFAASSKQTKRKFFQNDAIFWTIFQRDLGRLIRLSDHEQLQKQRTYLQEFPAESDANAKSQRLLRPQRPPRQSMLAASQRAPMATGGRSAAVVCPRKRSPSVRLLETFPTQMRHFGRESELRLHGLRGFKETSRPMAQIRSRDRVTREKSAQALYP